ncbi:MAG: GNAT family N-acetyltransferase [Gemmatimonadaceae bacterium]|nr:GNAT family N-acetyltransferase [Gemmatimonadaceae bacterium]
MHIDPVSPDDRGTLLTLATRTGLFSAEDAEGLLGGVLDGLTAGALAEGSVAFVSRPAPSAPANGWTYVAPDDHAAGVWNLWWLGVDPRAHGTGAATALVRRAEAHARERGARLMIIETSALDPQARARRFYAREGYAAVGRVPDFYGAGDDKIIFFRSLTAV